MSKSKISLDEAIAMICERWRFEPVKPKTIENSTYQFTSTLIAQKSNVLNWPHARNDDYTKWFIDQTPGFGIWLIHDFVQPDPDLYTLCYTSPEPGYEIHLWYSSGDNNRNGFVYKSKVYKSDLEHLFLENDPVFNDYNKRVDEFSNQLQTTDFGSLIAI